MTLSSDSSALSDTNSCASPAFRTSGNRRNLGGEPIADRSRAVTTTDPLAVIARRVRITGYLQGVGSRPWAATARTAVRSGSGEQDRVDTCERRVNKKQTN